MLRLSSIAFLLSGALLLGPTSAALASRCTTNLISGGLHADCPDVNDPRLPACPPGTTKVVYDLDKPFPPDGTMSNSVIRTTAKSLCHGATKTVNMSGFVIGCWYPPDPVSGCRTVKVLNNGDMCLHLNDVALGCGPSQCQTLSVEQIAISNAGAGDRFICPPKDPNVSCRSQRIDGEEKFRLWIGGLCSSQQIENDSTTNACVSHWGATYYGYGPVKQRGGNPEPGWYDWKSGAFKITAVAGRPQCGELSECIGQDNREAPWDQTIVGVPRPETPPPCLDGVAQCSSAAGCFN
jgi:hypothetical protein